MSGGARAAFEQATVLITVGAGGVGKTTVAASLALKAALEGTGALVCTIDPARRLANSLGLSALGNAEQRIGDEVFAAAGLAPQAPLHAMMLDMKRTWDELIDRRASPEAATRIKANRFYLALSTALAGSQEYIAMDKLCELKRERDYPLIVLDTPPAAHAVDFLEAPNRVLDFLDNDAARWLLTPALKAGRLGLKLFGFGGGTVARTLSRFTGKQTLEELADFMLSLSSMNDTFRERAQQTRALMESPQTAFVLVTSPAPERLDEAKAFYTLLRERRLAVAAVVVNRVHEAPSGAAREAVAGLPDGPVRQKLEQTLKENEHLADSDARGVETLRRHVGATPVVLVPRFELDVHDVRSLWDTARYLWGEARPGEAR